MSSTISFEVTDHVGTVMLNRPDRNNAWTGRMETEYRQALAEAEKDDDVRVIVICGAGDRFCVGADGRALGGMTKSGTYDSGVREPLVEPGRGDDPDLAGRHSFLWGIDKPVIAAVHGAAAGVGLAIASFADLRFVAHGTKLTTAGAKIGMPAEFGLSWLLPRMVGSGVAADLLLTSRVFGAEEALSIGWANRLLDREGFRQAAVGEAAAIAAACAPSSLRAIKRQIVDDLRGRFADAEATYHRLVDEMVGSADFNEGVAAMNERRPPKF